MTRSETMSTLAQLRPQALRTLSFLFSDGLANRMTHLFSRKLVEQIRTCATDDFLEALFKAMDLAFCLSRSYRENIRDFSARYVFTTADGAVGVTAWFDDGEMHVDSKAAKEWTVHVQFTDAAALRRFLLGKSQDILDSILANEVQVHGNINYIYKFGFMARDLQRRLGA
jgi:hypothetical protein